MSGLMEPHVIVPVCSFSFAEQRVSKCGCRRPSNERRQICRCLPPPKKSRWYAVPQHHEWKANRKKRKATSLSPKNALQPESSVLWFEYTAWLRMAPHGSAWLRMAPHGSAWLVRGPQATVSGLDVCHMEDEVRKPVVAVFSPPKHWSGRFSDGGVSGVV